MEGMVQQLIHGLASSEQARRVTDQGRERRWKMVELKDRQQWEMDSMKIYASLILSFFLASFKYRGM